MRIFCDGVVLSRALLSVQTAAQYCAAKRAVRPGVSDDVVRANNPVMQSVRKEDASMMQSLSSGVGPWSLC